MLELNAHSFGLHTWINSSPSEYQPYQPGVYMEGKVRIRIAGHGMLPFLLPSHVGIL